VRALSVVKTNLMSAEQFVIQQHLPGYSELSFRTLAGFEFVLTKEIAGTNMLPAQALAKAKEQIPETVWALDGTKVVIQGFLLPVIPQRRQQLLAQRKRRRRVWTGSAASRPEEPGEFVELPPTR
jgi:hypothetical protein